MIGGVIYTEAADKAAVSFWIVNHHWFR